MKTLLQYACAITLTTSIIPSSTMANNVLTGQEKSAACAACHGIDGNSSNPEIPILAGQNAEYIVNQLSAFKSGDRQNDTMQGMVMTLAQSDMANLAAYYASQIPRSGTANKGLAIKGKTQYKMCWGCHGMNAEGYDGYPRLADQHSVYLINQINSFKNRTRFNPAMNSVADDLTDEDIEALGAYLGSINTTSISSSISRFP